MRHMESNVGSANFDDYLEMVREGLPASQDTTCLENPFVYYPGKISLVRAYIYSCICGKENTNTFSDDDFLAGCNRFAIENPVPTISTRCFLYGNSKDITNTVEDLQKK